MPAHNGFPTRRQAQGERKTGFTGYLIIKERIIFALFIVIKIIKLKTF